MTNKRKSTVWESGKTVYGLFTVPKEQKLINNLQLAELIDVHTIGNIEHNSDLSTLTKGNLFINVKDANIEKVEIDKITTSEQDFRNATVTLNVKLKNSQELVKVEKHLGVGRYSLLFDKQFTKQNIKAPAFATEGITTKNLPSIDKTFFGHYNSQLFSGGYASARAFYADNVVVPRDLYTLVKTILLQIFNQSWLLMTDKLLLLMNLQLRWWLLVLVLLLLLKFLLLI
nr:hypothetical protein [Mycoplasmopsis bovis]